MCGYTVVTHPIGMRNGFDQVLLVFPNLRLCRAFRLHAIVSSVVLAAPVSPETCYPPTVPFVPGDPSAQREFADLIKRDFESYIADAQVYFRCLDTERARAFEEAKTVSEDYGRFLQEMSQ